MSERPFLYENVANDAVIKDIRNAVTGLDYGTVTINISAGRFGRCDAKRPMVLGVHLVLQLCLLAWLIMSGPFKSGSLYWSYNTQAHRDTKEYSRKEAYLF